MQWSLLQCFVFLPNTLQMYWISRSFLHYDILLYTMPSRVYKMKLSNQNKMQRSGYRETMKRLLMNTLNGLRSNSPQKWKYPKTVLIMGIKTIFHFRSLVSHVIQLANYVCCEYGFMLMHVSHYSHEVVVRPNCGSFNWVLYANHK
jgi:hypothetical protein